MTGAELLNGIGLVLLANVVLGPIAARAAYLVFRWIEGPRR